MNEEIKKKLIDLEITPPLRTWDKISAALDEEVAAEFPSRLYELELDPPSKVWDSVATTLSYSEKLYHLELTPPSTAWEQISTALDDGAEVPRIMAVRRISVWKYAAAASIIAFLAFGVKMLTAERIGSDIVVLDPQKEKSQTQPAKKDEVQKKSEVISTEKKNSDEEVARTNNLPKEGPRETIAANTPAKNYSRRPNNYIKTTANHLSKTEFASPDAFCLTSLQKNAPGYQSNFSDAAYRYVVFENDNCELIRISKKLAEKLGCNVPDRLTPEYQSCIQQLKKWSEKIAQMNITPSADNFMNIMELLKSTEEKQF